MTEKIILASQSPRRKQLLEWAEIPFHIRVKETPEDIPENTSPDQVPVIIARNKALAIDKQDHETILAADTIVVLDNEIIGKPTDSEHAKEILRKLSARTHEVITGVVILHGDREVSFSDITRVTFHPLSEDQISFYVDKYKPFDKAGAYAIQEWIGVIGIEKIEGDFYNVMGLPVSRVVKTLQQLA